MRALKTAAGRALAHAAEHRLLPGLTHHYAGRKLAILQQFNTAFSADRWPQVAILGAGFDGLGPRLVRDDPERRVIEIDHPATSAATATVPLSPADSRRLVRLPLDLAAISRRDAFACCPALLPQLPTVFVLEGLLMYLDRPAAAALLRVLTELCLAPTAVLFTFMEPDARGGARFAEQHCAVDRWLRRRGEPFRWAMPRDELEAWLREIGLDLHELIDPESMRRWLAALAPNIRGPVLHAECLAIARARNSADRCL